MVYIELDLEFPSEAAASEAADEIASWAGGAGRCAQLPERRVALAEVFAAAGLGDASEDGRAYCKVGALAGLERAGAVVTLFMDAWRAGAVRAWDDLAKRRFPAAKLAYEAISDQEMLTSRDSSPYLVDAVDVCNSEAAEALVAILGDGLVRDYADADFVRECAEAVSGEVPQDEFEAADVLGDLGVRVCPWYMAGPQQLD